MHRGYSTVSSFCTQYNVPNHPTLTHKIKTGNPFHSSNEETSAYMFCMPDTLQNVEHSLLKITFHSIPKSTADV